jgi:hypothetical protein
VRKLANDLRRFLADEADVTDRLQADDVPAQELPVDAGGGCPTDDVFQRAGRGGVPRSVEGFRRCRGRRRGGQACAVTSAASWSMTVDCRLATDDCSSRVARRGTKVAKEIASQQAVRVLAASRAADT